MNAVRRTSMVLSLGAVVLFCGAPTFGQSAADPAADADAQQARTQLLSAAQLDTLVAPIALYPDPLLGQVLAASTYPLEVVEAQQWLLQNRGLRGSQLIDAAKQQNWDPSIQALVAFPDVLTLLNRDIRWTTDLGNAFLAQQADVMSSIQRMRTTARANGKLATTPQQTVTTETQDGQTAIQIQPADPQVIYVPSYNPEYVWGPPVWGAYPSLWYPGIGYGFGFWPGIYVGGFFGGFGGWGGWGWGCGWFGHGLFVNHVFFAHYGFSHFGGGFAGRTAWAHNPAHRLGVSYPNRALASRFNGAGPGVRGNSASRMNTGRTGAAGNGWRSFNGASRAPSAGGGTRSFAPSAANRSSFQAGNRAAAPSSSFRGGASQGYRAPAQNYRAPSQSYRAPSQSYHSAAPSGHYSAPSQHFSAPRSSGGGGHPSGGGGGHSSGGHSGGGRR